MKLKKLLSVVISLTLLLSIISVPVFADGNNVAKIGGTEYASVTSAISAATSGATVTLIGDETLTSAVTLYTDIILDLNGHTLTMNVTSGMTGAFYLNGHSLTVRDTSAGQAGLIDITSSSGNGAYGFYVSGSGSNLLLESGNIVAKNAAAGSNWWNAKGIQAVTVSSGSTFTMTGGSLTASNVNNSGTAPYAVYVTGGTANITGGSVIIDDYDTYGWSEGHLVYKSSGTVNVTGGKFKSPKQLDFNELGSKLPAGYTLADADADGFRAVVAPVAKIGETEYATLEDAVEAANAGDTIVLLNDITYDADHSVAVWEKEFNLDLNGHTFTTNSGVGKSLSNMGYTATAICFAVEGEATVSNGTIRTAYGAGVYAAGVTATLSGLDIESNTVGVQSTSEYSSAVRLTSAATVIIESGSYKGENAIAVSNSGGDVIVNGGDFDGKIFFSTGTNSGVSKSITINGGNFTNVEFVNPNKGTLTIYGGTFSVEPDAAYIASGYEAVDNDNGTWTVGKVKAGNLTEADETTEGYDVTYIATKQIVDENNNVIKNDVPVTVNVKVVTDGENTAAATATKDDVKVNEIIGDVMADIEENAVISVELEFVRDQVAVDTVNNTITYDVHPEAIISVNGVANAPVVVSNDALEDNAVFKIKLPVPDALAGNEYIKVIHRSAGYADDVQIYPVQHENDNYFVQLDVTHFSEFVLSANDLPLFSGYSISLNGYIDLNFYLNLAADQVTNGEGTVVNFSWDRGEDSYQVQTSDFVSGRGYKATVRIPAAEMSYTITASVKIDGVYQGSDQYSVRQYANDLLGLTNDEQLILLVKTMLDYGAKAQVAFGRTDVDLANIGIDYTMGNVTATMIDTAISAANNGSHASDMANVAGYVGAYGYTPSLIYLSGCTLRHYFIGQGISGNFAGTKPAGAYTAYYVEKTNIAAAELDKLQEFQTGGTTFYYSALDFVKAIISNYNESDPGYQLAAATYWYNQAANAFFANN